jgi:Family of unknown function (DUF5752)
MTQAGDPFVFVGCVAINEDLDRQALDERELMLRLEEAPLDSVFYHMHGHFLRHRIMTPYANDFATWAALQVRDHVLAERLAIVNPFEFGTLEALREELVSVVDDHLSRLSSIPRVEAGEPFYFMQSHIVQVPLGIEADTLAVFRDCLAEVDGSAIYFHMVEARGRLGHPTGDFAEWIRKCLGMEELAAQVARVDTYLSGVERVRARLLGLVDQALEGQR